MEQALQIEERKERVILAGVSWKEGDDAQDSLEELAELAQTAGAQVVGTVLQVREGIHPGTCGGWEITGNPPDAAGDRCHRYYMR